VGTVDVIGIVNFVLLLVVIRLLLKINKEFLPMAFKDDANAALDAQDTAITGAEARVTAAQATMLAPADATAIVKRITDNNAKLAAIDPAGPPPPPPPPPPAP
jgi:hypothetical protein